MPPEFNEEYGFYQDEKGNDYFVGRVNHNTFSIAKFHDGETRPTDVYTVTKTDKWRCNCPGFYSGVTSKHIDMVKDWLLRGEPLPVAFRDTDFVVTMAQEE